MLYEVITVMEHVTAERPLLLVLEDLHWSDASTLAWLAYMARRRERARLLVLGTYRPVEAIVAAHPLRSLALELKGRGQCEEMLLDYLPEEAVAAYRITSYNVCYTKLLRFRGMDRHGIDSGAAKFE